MESPSDVSPSSNTARAVADRRRPDDRGEPIPFELDIEDGERGECLDRRSGERADSADDTDFRDVVVVVVVVPPLLLLLAVVDDRLLRREESRRAGIITYVSLVYNIVILKQITLRIIAISLMNFSG